MTDPNPQPTDRIHADLVEPAAITPVAAVGTLDFLRAAEIVVAHLAGSGDFESWFVTRLVDADRVVLACDDATRGTVPGDLAPLPRKVAASSVASSDPHDEATITVVADPGPDEPACVLRLPLEIGDEGLVGELWGLRWAPHPDPVSLQGRVPSLTVLARLLATVLALDLDRSRLQRSADAARNAALEDGLTGLGNWRAFDLALDNEQSRCERFGHQAGVIVADLDDLKQRNDEGGHAAGDRLLRRAAHVLRDTVRDADQAFRIGGDEFALLLPEVSADHLDSLRLRLVDALEAAGVSASIGAAIRRTGFDLRAVTAEADAAMYEEKLRRRRAPR